MDKVTFHTQITIDYHSEYAELIKRFRKGDAVTDFELRTLLTHYLQLDKILFAEGERMYLAWKDAHDQTLRLIDMQNARRNR